jgi:flagellar biosynthesis/type III secretory pathway ATPase
LGAAGHYPAIDVLQSVSRLAPRLYTPEQREAALKIRDALTTHQRSEDLINLGAYASGANPKLDAAIRLRPQLLDFLKQDAAANAPFDQTMTQLRELARLAG